MHGIKGLLCRNRNKMYQSIFYIGKVTGGLLDPIKSAIGLK